MVKAVCVFMVLWVTFPAWALGVIAAVMWSATQVGWVQGKLFINWLVSK